MGGMIDIFLCVYRGGFGEDFVVIVFLIDLFRRDVYIVSGSIKIVQSKDAMQT